MFKKVLFFLLVIIALITLLYFKRQSEIPDIFKGKEKKVLHRKIGGIDWFTEYSFEKAFEKAKKENKLVLVVFSSNFCGVCKAIERDIFTDKKFKEILKFSVPVFVDSDTMTGLKLFEKYKLKANPVFIVFNSKKEMLDKFVGGVPSVNFYCTMVKTNYYGINKGNIVEKIRKGEIDLSDCIDYSYFCFQKWGKEKEAEVLIEGIKNYHGNECGLLLKAFDRLVWFESRSKDKKRRENLLKTLLPFLKKCKDNNIFSIERDVILNRYSLTPSELDSVVEKYGLNNLFNYENLFPYIVNDYFKIKQKEKAFDLIDKGVKFLDNSKLSFDERAFILRNIADSVSRTEPFLKELDKKDRLKLLDILKNLKAKYRGSFLIYAVYLKGYINDFEKALNAIKKD